MLKDLQDEIHRILASMDKFAAAVALEELQATEASIPLLWIGMRRQIMRDWIFKYGTGGYRG